MTQRTVTVTRESDVAGSIEIEVIVEGAGPLMLCIHGWPELWYSWRHQMSYFGARGWTVAAMNVRGYGGSSNPAEIEAYTLRELVGDAAAVIDELSADGTAVVLGHDWGAPIAGNTARLHPDKVSGLVILSVPYSPVGPDNSLDMWREMFTRNDQFFYQVYFDDNRGGAEDELGADSLTSLRIIYFGASGDAADTERFESPKPASSKMLDGRSDPDPFPDWASDADLKIFADAMDQSGWHGPLNRYRAQPLDAADIGQMPGGNITQPSTFIGGELDVVRRFVDGFDPYEVAGAACDDFRGATVIPGAGHWVQQEAPDATNAALQEFFEGL